MARKTVTVDVVTFDDVTNAALDLGINLTNAEANLLAAACEADGADPVVEFDKLLDARVGPAARALNDYPDVRTVLFPKDAPALVKPVPPAPVVEEEF